MLNTLSNLKHKWPRGLPTFSFKFFFCVVHVGFCICIFFIFSFLSLKLSNRFVAGIRLPHAKVNKDLVELLHPKVTLFFSISRQPVPKRERIQWIRCIFLHLYLFWKMLSWSSIEAQIAGEKMKPNIPQSEVWNGTARQNRTKSEPNRSSVIPKS